MSVISMYDLLGLKGNSIFKSYFIKPFNDNYANVHIEIEAYDDTFLNAIERNTNDYIFAQLEKKLTNKKVIEKIENHLGLERFKGALVTLYDDRVHEMYYRENGVNQYNIEW